MKKILVSTVVLALVAVMALVLTGTSTATAAPQQTLPDTVTLSA